MSNIPITSKQQREAEQYLHHIVGLDISINDKIILIDIVRSILSHFVDRAFGVQTDQITLQSAGKLGFNEPCDRDAADNHPENQIAQAHSNGLGSDTNPQGPNEP